MHETEPSPRAQGAARPVVLPPKLPQQKWRPAQSNVPNDRATRDKIKLLCTMEAERLQLVPPSPLDELREHAAVLREREGLDAAFDDYIAVLLNNAAWRDALAQIPYERRLLLLPKCLRVEEHCPAPFDEFGLLCKECGLCSIQDLSAEAERLGYAVLVAEGSAIVRQMVETGKIEAVVGVSCLNVLERSFPHLEAAAVPGIAIPLLQDDCIDCNVDLDWVWDVIHLTADDQTHRLDLEQLRGQVQDLFAPEALARIMGPAEDVTARIAQDWLQKDGKRWRPYLASCVHMALSLDGSDAEPVLGEDVAKLAVAVECFHKASLIHDDIEDGDQRRYGQPTLHMEHGEAVAINVGDFLLGEGYRLITEIDAPAERKVEMLRIAAQGHVTLSRGQGTELSWARDPRPLESMEVLQIFQQKTAPAFAVALQLGAIIAGADTDLRKTLDEYSDSLGIAYQIKDDLEDYSGESDSNDLVDLRPSLLLAIARKRAKGAEEQDLLERVWNRQLEGPADTARLLAVLRERGVLDKAQELLEAYQEQAIRSLRFLANPSLKGLLRRVVGKIFPRTLIEGYCTEFETRNAAGRAAGAEAAS